MYADGIKIDPSRIAFDIDGVVADTMSLFLSIAGDFGVTGIRYEDITEYDVRKSTGLDDDALTQIILRILSGEHAFSLYPLPGAIHILKRLNKRHRPTLFVTARPDAEHIEEWLLARLDVSPSDIEIVATGSFSDKKDVLLEKGVSWFVDDRLETCFVLAEAGVTPIVFNQPWNRKPHPFLEVSSWNEIEEMINF
ncbi:MAG: haloacid dehalogenase [Deltaproteobacteria bacterium]|nr:haloacid dehalogenase [Deltaproteobacteria bacterium]